VLFLGGFYCLSHFAGRVPVDRRAGLASIARSLAQYLNRRQIGLNPMQVRLSWKFGRKLFDHIVAGETLPCWAE